MTWSALLWKSLEFGDQSCLGGLQIYIRRSPKGDFWKPWAWSTVDTAVAVEYCVIQYNCVTLPLGEKNATFVWLIFTFWHVCAITCSVTVGLEYVTEIQVIGQSPRYHCELCDSKFDHNLKFPHLVGSKHRFNVLVSNVDLWNSKWNCFGSNVLINMESLLKLLSGSHKWWFCQWNHYFVRETSSDKKMNNIIMEWFASLHFKILTPIQINSK